MGLVATIFGVGVALMGFILPEGNGDVSNLAAMNLKTNLVIAGSALFVSGVVISSATRVERAMKARDAADAMERAIDRRVRETSRGIEA